MEHIIEVERNHGKPSKIVIGEVLDKVEKFTPAKRIIIITDSNVHRRYRELIDNYEHIIIGLGETNKTLVTVDKIYRELLNLDVDRNCFILGFGGGIVTDITGFVASTYMRGLPFGFIASTLLAQVDASVGGKNGVNVDGYKNIVGLFNQPDFVLCDYSVLKTLPERDFRTGLAEVIKAGIIADPELFALFENHSFDEFKENKELLTDAIKRAIEVKIAIVEQDEFETDLRRKLNLGHTFGHAIEKSSSKFLHGEAVAAGLSIISDMAVKLGVLENEASSRIKETLSKHGFNTELDIENKVLLKAIRHDKKRDSDFVNIVLPTSIGSCEIKKIAFEKLEELFED